MQLNSLFLDECNLALKFTEFNTQIILLIVYASCFRKKNKKRQHKISNPTLSIFNPIAIREPWVLADS